EGVGPVGPDLVINQTITGTQTGAGVAADAQGNYVVIWAGAGAGGDGSDIYARLYNANGTPRGGEFRVNATMTGIQANYQVAMAPDGTFVIAWSNVLGDDWSRKFISARVFDAAGNPRSGSDIAVTTFSSDRTTWVQSLAMDPTGDFVVLYGDNLIPAPPGWKISRQMYYQRYNALGQAEGKRIRVDDSNTYYDNGTLGMDQNGNVIA